MCDVSRLNGVEIAMTLVVVAAIVSVVITMVVAVIGANLTSETTITVTEKIGAHGNDGIYLILTEEGEAFTVADNLFKMKFDATDRYMGLEPGERYHVVCTGWRFQPLSWYRNIIEATPIGGSVAGHD